MTGYYRTGCCESDESDLGNHSVCVEVTEEFLAFSELAGNPLGRPAPDFGFPGLKPGDRWCVCAGRWLEACEAGYPAPIVLASTHERALEVIELEVLKAHACG